MATQTTPSQPKKQADTYPSWHGLAYILEAFVLLVFIAVSIGVLLHAFEKAHTHSQNADSLSYAVIIASNQAEYFTANAPDESVVYYQLVDGTLTQVEDRETGVFVATTSVTEEITTAGILYRAQITVTHYDEIVYELETAFYLSGKVS